MCLENKEIAASKAPDELLNWGDIQKMKLSWRVAQESMRLTPPSPASFRVATREMSFDGFRIPKSWKVCLSAVHKSNSKQITQNHGSVNKTLIKYVVPPKAPIVRALISLRSTKYSTKNM